jgi:hypothetical protein
LSPVLAGTNSGLGLPYAVAWERAAYADHTQSTLDKLRRWTPAAGDPPGVRHRRRRPVAAPVAHRARRGLAARGRTHRGLTAHSRAETYAMPTRLPGDGRVTGEDAARLLEANFETVLTVPTRSRPSFRACFFAGDRQGCRQRSPGRTGCAGCGSSGHPRHSRPGRSHHPRCHGQGHRRALIPTSPTGVDPSLRPPTSVRYACRGVNRPRGRRPLSW